LNGHPSVLKEFQQGLDVREAAAEKERQNKYKMARFIVLSAHLFAARDWMSGESIKTISSGGGHDS
jgi:hypothetical protein